eukprot:2533348-Alexandrium_andersonii.AAC.1
MTSKSQSQRPRGRPEEPAKGRAERPRRSRSRDRRSRTHEAGPRCCPTKLMRPSPLNSARQGREA